MPNHDTKEELTEIAKLRRTLDSKHLAFVEAYVGGSTASEAHVVAKLSEDADSNKRQANALLRAPRIRAYIEALQREASERAVFSIEQLDQKLFEIVNADVADIVEVGEGVDAVGIVRPVVTMKNLADLTPGQRAAISSIRTADGSVVVTMVDKMKAFDMLNKRLGGYVEKVELEASGTVQVVAMPGNNGRGPGPRETK